MGHKLGQGQPVAPSTAQVAEGRWSSVYDPCSGFCLQANQLSCKLSAQLWNNLALSSWGLPALSLLGGPGGCLGCQGSLCFSLSLSLSVKVCTRCLSALGCLVVVRGHTHRVMGDRMAVAGGFGCVRKGGHSLLLPAPRCAGGAALGLLSRGTGAPVRDWCLSQESRKGRAVLSGAHPRFQRTTCLGSPVPRHHPGLGCP